MGRWDERFDGHSVWGAVSLLRQQLDDLPTVDESSELAARDRLQLVCARLEEHKQASSKELYSASMLAALDSALMNSVNNYLRDYLAAPSDYPGHLITAGDNADEVLDALARCPALPKQGQAQAAGRAFSEYKDAAVGAIDWLNESYKEARKDAQSLSQEIATERANLASLRARFEDSLATRESEYNDALRLLSVTGAEDYKKSIQTQVDLYDERLNDYSTRAESFSKKAELSARTAADWEESSKTSAQWLADRTVATDFGRQARRSSAAAWLYDIAAVAVASIPLTILLVHFLGSSGEESTAISTTLARVSISVASLIIAGYLFSRGATNHRHARASKSADIRLGTVEAFISRLPEDEAAAVRRGMADSIYLRGRLSDEDDAPVGNSILSFLARQPRDEGADAKPETADA